MLAEPEGLPGVQVDKLKTPARNTALRAALMDTARVPIEAEIGRKVIFVVSVLRTDETWAYLQAVPRNPDGSAINWAKTPFAERIQGKTLPVLVVAGENDPALGAETCRATWLKHYPNARLEVMGNAGHYPMDETPVALATVVESFLREAMPG